LRIWFSTLQAVIEFVGINRYAHKATPTQKVVSAPSPLRRKLAGAYEVVQEVDRVDYWDSFTRAIDNALLHPCHAIVNEDGVGLTDVGNQFAEDARFNAKVFFPRAANPRHHLDVAAGYSVTKPDA